MMSAPLPSLATRIGIAAAALMIIGLLSDGPARSQTEVEPFAAIASVLQSPRCMNCHPAGDAPLQTDLSRPHKQNIKRAFADLGGTCRTCHQDTAMPGAHLPPGALHWSMPPAETPMIFEGKSMAQLCADLQDPEQNGGRSLDDLVRHVSSDPLVLWAFNPGGSRTLPPLTQEDFIAAMTEWVVQGAPCPN